jgi:hypothetical protein
MLRIRSTQLVRDLVGVSKTLVGCAEWLDIVIDAMVKSCRFVPECGAARRLAGVALDKKTESATLPLLGGRN